MDKVNKDNTFFISSPNNKKYKKRKINTRDMERSVMKSVGSCFSSCRISKKIFISLSDSDGFFPFYKPHKPLCWESHYFIHIPFCLLSYISHPSIPNSHISCNSTCWCWKSWLLWLHKLSFMSWLLMTVSLTESWLRDSSRLLHIKVSFED